MGSEMCIRDRFYTGILRAVLRLSRTDLGQLNLKKNCAGVPYGGFTRHGELNNQFISFQAVQMNAPMVSLTSDPKTKK